MKYASLFCVAATALSVAMVPTGAMAQAQATPPAAPAAAAPGLATMTLDQLKEKGYDRVFFQSNLGSFKCINGEGHFEFTFQGTVLVSQLDGKLTQEGTIRQEYDAHGRKVYSGKGKMILDGKWRGVQWFGSDMTGKWEGLGVMRVVGEFDRNLKTGEYWYEAYPDHFDWNASGVISILLPRQLGGARTDVVPKERKKGG